MHEVRDGSRKLQFDGKLIGGSSSWRRGSLRWAEFALYKTENGKYVLSRIGVSLVYHGAACHLVRKYKLVEEPSEILDEESVPCEECSPVPDLPMVFPEKYRYWTQVSETAGAVLDALYKTDENNSRYLTHVAKRLLEEASSNDENISRVYRTEIIE